MIKFFSKIRFLLTHILPPTTIDLSDGTWNALKGLPDYEKIYLRNNVRTKKSAGIFTCAALYRSMSPSLLIVTSVLADEISPWLPREVAFRARSDAQPFASRGNNADLLFDCWSAPSLFSFS